MTNYYLDTETTGLDPEKDEIITIQYQSLDREGKPNGDLVILKSWESSEEEIIKRFHKIFVTDFAFDFIPVGFNLIFDLSFLYCKFMKYNLPMKSSFMNFLFKDKPHIDIKFICILANNLEFRGSGLDKMTNKKTDGRIVLDWYANKEYLKIEQYIREETKAFLDVLQIMKQDLMISKEKWKIQQN